MYEKFYKLSGPPFKLTPDHRFFYRSAGHKKAMSYLQFGIHQGEGFIVITGNVGAGKSTLVRQLFAELDTSKVIASQIVTTQIEATGIVKLILSAFNLPIPNFPKIGTVSVVTTLGPVAAPVCGDMKNVDTGP